MIDGKIDLAPLTHRLDMIEEAVLSREAATREISDRLRGQEDVLAADRATVRESHDKLLSELKTMAGAHRSRKQRDRRRRFSIHLTARLEGLAGVIEGRHSETAQALASNAATIAQLIERLASTEIASREHTKRVAELQQNYAQELTEVHDALMKLNTNQHTLAGSIDHWRQDTASTMSIIGSRMETVEREAAKPVALLESHGPDHGSHAQGDGGALLPPQPFLVLAVRHRRLDRLQLAGASLPHRRRRPPGQTG